jgi:hypothetical protein
MYIVASPDIFNSASYLRTRGMGPFLSVVDERLHRRNLFEGLDTAPDVPIGAVLVVADRAAADPTAPGLVWLRAVALDRSTAYRGIAVFPDLASARKAAARLGGAACYAPMTERLQAA